MFRCKPLLPSNAGRRACEGKRNVAIIGSVPKCVAHSEQNDSIRVIVPIKCPNIFCDLPLGMGVFQQALLLRAKRDMSDAHGCECNPPLKMPLYTPWQQLLSECLHEDRVKRMLPG